MTVAEIWAKRSGGTMSRWATEALAGLGDWRRVVESMMQWGLRTHRKVVAQRCSQGPLSDSILRPAIDSLSTDVPSPGAILAIGISGRPDLAERIHGIAGASKTDSDLMLACILALDDLNDRSERTEKLFVRQLSVPKHRHAATIGLLHIGTRSALDALRSHIDQKYDHVITANLALQEEYREAAARSLWNELHRSQRDGLADALIDCLGYLREQEVRDFLRDISFDVDRASIFVGNRTRAIRGLAKFDPESGFLAARKALQDEKNRDRIEYPYLLMELDRSRAQSILLEQFVKETDATVVAALGRVLRDSKVDLLPTVIQWTNSEDDGVRSAGCRLASWMSPSPTLVALLRARLDDIVDDVAEAGREALRSLSITSEVALLVTALRKEADESQKWILLDSLLALADPGDKGTAWPSWARDIVEFISPFAQLYLADKLGKRRETVAKELGKQKA